MDEEINQLIEYDSVSMSTTLIEQAEAIQGLSQTEMLTAARLSGFHTEEDSDGEGYTVDDIQGVLENNEYTDAISVQREELKPDSLPPEGDQSSQYCDAWSAKPSDAKNSNPSTYTADNSLIQPGSDIAITLTQPHSSPSVIPELKPAPGDSLPPPLIPLPLSNDDSDASDKSSKSGSPGHVLKIVESWEGNIDEYNLVGRDSRSPHSGSADTIESPRSDSSGDVSSPRSGTQGLSSSQEKNPWKPSAYKTAPQPLPGMVKPSIYSLARNSNLDPNFVSEQIPEENLYECVAPVAETVVKKPSPYDPPWSDDYTDPTESIKGGSKPPNMENGKESDSSHIDPTTGESLYDTPENFSGSYDHLNLFKARRQKPITEDQYGIHSGKSLQASTEQGRMYKKKHTRKADTKKKTVRISQNPPKTYEVEKHPEFQGSGKYDEVADESSEEFYEPVGRQSSPSDPRSSTINSALSWGSDFSRESSEEEENGTLEYPDKPLPPLPDPSKLRRASPEEECPVKPVNINLEKHPPPCLPPSPEELTKEQEKKAHVVRNIIDSEKSYMDSLSRIVNDYKSDILFKYNLDKECVRVVFSKAQEILHHHMMFQIELAESVSKWYTEEKIGGIFTASFSRDMVVNVYSEYVNNFAMTMEEIKAAQVSKPGLEEFLNNMSKRSVDRLNLFGLMVKPIQRFPQFIMLIKDLLKYTPHHHHDRSSLQTALTDLENVTHILNERKRESEELFQAKKLQKVLNFKVPGEKQPRLVRQDDMEEMSQDRSVATKVRKLYLLDDCIICCSVQGNNQKVKWMKPIHELELKDTAITPDMQSILRVNSNKFSIQTPVVECKEDDLFNLHSDISDMMHDVTVLGQISTLVNSLKLSYECITEEKIQEAKADLQLKIQAKDQQLQVLNSSTITLQDAKYGGKEYRSIFQTTSPEIKQEWSIDFIMTKLTKDPLNNPSWFMSGVSGKPKSIHQPAMYVKHMSVDLPKHFTKVKCAVPVYLSDGGGNSDNSLQHLWVVTTSETRAQVSLVSVQTTRLALIESFKAADTEIVTVETVPAISLTEQDEPFVEDTIWMSTEKCEILVYSLLDENGVRNFTTGGRKPRSKFYCHGIAVAMKYADDRVFVGLRDGKLIIYDRDDTTGKWKVEAPSIVEIGCDMPISCIIAIEDEIWVACSDTIYIIPVDENQFKDQLVCDGGAVISEMVRSGCGLWMSFKDKSYVRLYHIETKENLQEINIGSTVDRMMSESKYSSEEKIPKTTTVTSLMASRGLLWVGTSLGIVCSLPLPRLRDGVPLIKGRPDISLHSHNGPVQFLIPIYCGTVNLWQRAQGLQSTESLAWRENATSVRRRKGSRDSVDEDIPKQDKEDEQEIPEGKANGPQVTKIENNFDIGSNGLDRRKSKSAEDLVSRSPVADFLKSENIQSRALTLRTELMQKLAKRNLATPDTSSQGDENEIRMYYGDLMSNEDYRKEQAPLKRDISPQGNPKLRKDEKSETGKPVNLKKRVSENFKNFKRSITQRPSFRAHGSERASAVYETLRRRNCNAVVVVSGGDGYIDWRTATQTHKIHSTEASMMLWIYKF
ncbi:rho guanine nucleotide exchange factor 10-like isoform X2 [Saccostrea cucullata]|uniref:rho guanine nucleotide exchange factor 10-like isoform X2 n=1 Tax=Saccostrea cuccullata TaxID=36930 RepID=UPI002ED26710